MTDGTAFAFGNATTGYGPTANTNPAYASIPTVQQQVGLFLLSTGGSAPSTALYSVWGGATDLFHILDNVGSFPDPVATAQAAAQFEAGTIGALIGVGARDVLVPLVPDLSLAPAYRGTPVENLSRTVSQAYNSALEEALKALGAIPGVDVTVLDTFGAVDAIVADPGAYGLTNAAQACYPDKPGDYTGGGTFCATPDQYLFWDWVHPTAAGHAIIAQAAYGLVPEPASVAIFAAGLTAFSLLRRRRQAGPAPARAGG